MTDEQFLAKIRTLKLLSLECTREKQSVKPESTPMLGDAGVPVWMQVSATAVLSAVLVSSLVLTTSLSAGELAPRSGVVDITAVGNGKLEFEGNSYAVPEICKVLETRFNQAKPKLVRVHGARVLGDFFMPTVLSTWYGYELVLVDGEKSRAVTVSEQTDNFQAPPDCDAINIHAKIHVED